MHEAINFRKARYPLIDVNSTAEFILRVQKENGEIPWSEGGKTDPWDHVESAMGLTVAGYYEEAKRAYIWSSMTQMDDGSWWSYYKDDKPIEEAYKDSNMTAYISVGVLHYYLATGDYSFLRLMWNTVSKSIDYVIGLQGESGEIAWAKRMDGSIDRMALTTGSSSIYLSMNCAIKIATLLNKQRPHWKRAKKKLENAIKYKHELFDQSKSRFSMDWYYPILCGVLKERDAQRRVNEYWKTFVVDEWGVLCVSDQPWVTMAETSEFVMALAAMGDYKNAEAVYEWLLDKKYDDGAFWTGVTVPDKVIYTTEKTTWTGGAVLLATDMLYGITSASQLFSHSFWTPNSFSSTTNRRVI